jgi:hypothetical protein
MMVNCSLLVLASFFLSVASLPINTTVILPLGNSNHGNPNLLCIPNSWSDIAVFFIGNFVAHAATVRSLPGEKLADQITGRVVAVLAPGFGLLRGIMAISTFAAFGKTKLEKAARAGILFMVVRSLDWKPRDGDCVDYAAVRQIKYRENLDQTPLA